MNDRIIAVHRAIVASVTGLRSVTRLVYYAKFSVMGQDVVEVVKVLENCSSFGIDCPL